MRRLFAILLASFGLCSAALAQDTALLRLEEREIRNVWGSVGRLNIEGTGFCTGTLIAPDLVLTAAHCFFDPTSGAAVDAADVKFLAGWREGRASAFRAVRRIELHPDYHFGAGTVTDRVRHDVALVQLKYPIGSDALLPFKTAAAAPAQHQQVSVVSYALGRSDAPSLQSGCGIVQQAEELVVTTCSVGFGSSGAPMFSFSDGHPRIVSVVSAKAEFDGMPVAVGTGVARVVDVLMANITEG